MKTEIENMDDIVFDERNQNYGAYFLRRSYNKNVTRALFISVFIFSAIVTIPLIAGFMQPDKKLTDGGTYEMDSTLIAPPIKKDDLPIIPDDPIEMVKVPSFKAIQVVTDTTEVTSDLGELIEATKDGFVNEKEGDGLIVENPKEHVVIDQGTIEKPVIYVDVMPIFKGGEEEMYLWLGENIRYPQVAKESGIQGTVVVTFVVEKDGSITSIQILRDIGGGCGDEAIRVVQKMPKWKEGRQSNVPVRVQFNLPIKFTLE